MTSTNTGAAADRIAASAAYSQRGLPPWAAERAGQKPVALGVTTSASRSRWVNHVVATLSLLSIGVGGTALVSVYAEEIVAHRAARVADDTASVPLPPLPPIPAPQAAPVRPPMRTVMVRPGNTLAGLMRSVYGAVTEQHLALVRDANPKIRNFDLIRPGDILNFPAADNLPSRDVTS
jgi:nucleoid-associated protein YgaU